ncbi:substrate-binding domain-containing protein [Microbacterium sp. CIAB417]|uniref:substrate-binding domain-containing protein n=1 Tax=Microbacterium sp. CIAB417 TaxID=2860287 RepID=UPI001FAB7EA4|nr:substrate-binding domain-containing protein [Microbacterium sp. CIAB417]
MTDDNAHALLAAERREHVLAALARDGAVRISQLVDDLGVTPVTLRRDLAQMEGEGLLVRVHGGAVAPKSATVPASPPAAVTDPEPPTRTVAVLVPSLNYYWPGVVRGMEAEARARGLNVVLRGASYELQDERPVLERIVANDDISGLIVAPNTDTPHAQDVMQWLHESGIPTVLVERDAVTLPDGAPVESVTTDHALGARLAARHLAALGHRRVGLVMSRNSPTSRKIAQGWHGAVEELGLQPSPQRETILPDRASGEFTAEVNAALDSMRDAGITGLLVHSDPEAMAVVDLALNRGISVPEDLSIIAYDDEVAQLFTPALTAVSPPRASVGRTAVDMLVHRMGSPDRPVHRVQLSPQLIVRASTAAPRA